METTSAGFRISVLLVATALTVACNEESETPESSAAAVASAAAADAKSLRSFPVSGSAVHYFSTAIVHSREPTGTGRIQRSTDIVELSGDLRGYVLYHPTSVFDVQAETLVNTGTQVFSGTVAGSGPVLLHGDEFRFDVDLATGETTGEVHLRRSEDAPHPGHWFECDLEIVGTGQTPEGDNLADYTGSCTEFGDTN